jgi:folate-binding protein YgfZ
MTPLVLREFHFERGARFADLNGAEIVAAYGAVEEEYLRLTGSAALLDLSFRSRVCVLGADRKKFVHGQVTNDVLGLNRDQGCYAALVNAKGKIQSDLFVYKLSEEILLDFEPGLLTTVLERLQKYIIAEEVELVDVAPHYGLLSIQGPLSAECVQASGLFDTIPVEALRWISRSTPDGEVYLVNNPRFDSTGFDLFIPVATLLKSAEALSRAVQVVGGDWTGFEATEIARIENGIPRFGADMSESNLAPEAVQERAISYKKGCYIGQEVIARIRTYGQVAKSLRLLRLPNELPELARPGERLFSEGKEVGHITSSTLSPKYGGKVALGYVRKEVNAPGTTLELNGVYKGAVQIIGIPGQA